MILIAVGIGYFCSFDYLSLEFYHCTAMQNVDITLNGVSRIRTIDLFSEEALMGF